MDKNDDLGFVADEELGFVPDESAIADTAKKSLPYLLKALDYPRGLVSSGLAYGAQQASGKKLLPKQEFIDAVTMKGDFPTTDEYMKRAGAGEGGKLSDILPSMYNDTGEGLLKLQKGGMLDPTTRGTVGWTVDTLLDPSSWPTLGLKNKVLKTIARPSSNILERAGKKTYKSGLKELDYAAKKAGKKPVSDYLWDRNIWGTNARIANKSADAMGELLEKQQNILRAAQDAGATVDMNRAMSPAMEMTQKMMRDPGKRGVANEMDDFILNYLAEAPQSPMVASDWKTTLYKLAGPDSYQQGVRNTPFKDEVYQEMGRGLKEEIENVADKALPKNAGEMKKVNEELGTLLSTANAMGREAIKGQRKNLVTSVDALLAGSGLMLPATPRSIEQALALKKLADASKTTAVRTSLGMGAKKLGESKAVYPLLKRAIIDNPWSR